MYEHFLFKDNIGEFFTKMYEAHKGENTEVTLVLNDDKIQIYNRKDCKFTDIKLLDEKPNVDELINEF